MKIVDVQEFMELPDGTLFADHMGDEQFGGFFAKGETVVVDGRNVGYWYHDFIDPYAEDSTDLFRKMHDMCVQKASYPLDPSETKVLPVNGDELFLIYEKADLQIIRAAIDKAPGN
jgi:hypothetical protein